MKVIFQFIDNWVAYNQTMMGGIGCPNTRIIEIELTNEQKSKLQKRKVGNNGRTEIFEDLKFIQLIED